MSMGLAGALLVFTGLWHAFEWMMGGRNQDTLRLIPIGVIYAVLGYLIVTHTGEIAVPIFAAALTAIGAVSAFMMRKGMEVRPWVTWAFIVIDVAIIVAILSALLG